MNLGHVFSQRAAIGTAVAAAPAKRPNILLIVADDLGYTDIGPFGAEAAHREGALRQRIGFTIGPFQRRQQQGAAAQRFGPPER